MANKKITDLEEILKSVYQSKNPPQLETYIGLGFIFLPDGKELHIKCVYYTPLESPQIVTDNDYILYKREASPEIKKVINYLVKKAPKDPENLSFKLIDSTAIYRFLFEIPSSIPIWMDIGSGINKISHTKKTPLDYKINIKFKDSKIQKFLLIKSPYCPPDILLEPNQVLITDTHFIYFNDGYIFILKEESLDSIAEFIFNPCYSDLNPLEFTLSVDKLGILSKFILEDLPLNNNFNKILQIERSTFKVTSIPFFEYSEEFCIAYDSKSFTHESETGKPPIIRSISSEESCLNELQQAGFYKIGNSWNCDIRFLDKITKELEKINWLVKEVKKTETGKFKEIIRLQGNLNLNINYRSDWFDISGDVDFSGEKVPLPHIIEALKKGKNEVSISPSKVGLISETWLRNNLGFWVQLEEEKGQKLKLHKSMIGALSRLSDEKDNFHLEIDKKTKLLIEKVADFKRIEQISPPNNLICKLRDYQKEGISWLHFLKEFQFGGILADDMGLGKTVQILSHLLEDFNQNKKGCSLIVMPASLIFNWEAEAQKFTPDLKTKTHYGSSRKLLKKDLQNFQIIFTTYGTLRNDIDKFKSLNFRFAILDESQNIKNPSTKSYKAVKQLQAQNKICLTGTPIENHLGELWSQFAFIMPTLLGPFSYFERNYIKTNIEENREILKSLIFPFILRRKKQDVAKDLPPKIEQTILCEMDKSQEALYNQLKDSIRGDLLNRIDSEGINKTKLNVIEGLLRLRQISCHPRLVHKNDLKNQSGKLQTLIEMVKEIVDGDHKVLIFSQFTSMLHLIRDELISNEITYEYLDGKTKNRQAAVEKFQTNPKVPVFLISLKAGGVGLNLTSAEYVFVYDPWWNPAVEMQAIDRAYRIGQKNTVFSYRLISKGTVEEKIIKLQEKKKELVESVISNEKSLVQNLTKEDINFLFS